MKRTDKKKMVEVEVKELFNEGAKIDDIAAHVFGKYSDRLKFSEIDRLVKDVLRDAGLLKTRKEINEKFEMLVDKDLTHLDGDREAIDAWIDLHVQNFGITKNKAKDHLKAAGIKIPKKVRGRSFGGWRAALADAIHNGERNLSELMVIVSYHVKSESVAMDYVRDYAPMVIYAVDGNFNKMS